ncbi:MAG: hypothetical protein Q8Q05_02260, partial [bacterium]|nr:hypothetical protein [bacterium]
PTIGATILQQRQENLAVAQKRLDTLFDMRQNGEISSSEFVERKNRCQSEITMMQVAIREMEKLREQILGSIHNGIDYLTTAYQRFTQGSNREKRQVATLLADEYALTLGKFEMQPHPLLDLLRSIELPSGDRQQVHLPVSGDLSLVLSGW